jgi:hypothetical protein
MLFLTYLILDFSFYTSYFTFIYACAPSPLRIHIAFQITVLLINSFMWYSCVSRTLDMVKVRTTSRPTVINLSTLQMKGERKSYENVWFPFMYSQKWNFYFQNRIIMFCVSQFLQSYICERVIYFQDWSAYSAAEKYLDQSWEYINRSQTHECGNWD